MEPVFIEGGEFAMGSEEFYPDEAPIRTVRVPSFWIDPVPVTNDRFHSFIDATGFVTEAERPPTPDLYPGAAPEDLVPGALVFSMPPEPVYLNDYRQWWTWQHGASWKHPFGPGSDLTDLGDHPVVHVSHADAVAFCAWDGGSSLPRPSGNTQHEGVSTGTVSNGGKRIRKSPHREPTRGKVSFRTTTRSSTASPEPRQSDLSHRTGTASST